MGRIGPKRGVIAGLVVLAFASFAFALAGGPVALGIARFVQGLRARRPGRCARVGRGQRPARGSQALGTVFGLAVFGFIVGPMFGGVADVVGIRPSFALVALVAAGLAAGLAVVEALPREEPRPGAASRALRDRAFLVSGSTRSRAVLRGARRPRPLHLDDAGYGAGDRGLLRRRSRRGLRQSVVGRVSDQHGRLLPVRVALAASIVVAAALALATEPLVGPRSSPASVTFGGFGTRDGARRGSRSAPGSHRHRLRRRTRHGRGRPDRSRRRRSARPGVRRPRPVSPVRRACALTPRRCNARPLHAPRE